jgi:DNA-binding FrmR family transcriptional regulator
MANWPGPCVTAEKSGAKTSARSSASAVSLAKIGRSFLMTVCCQFAPEWKSELALSPWGGYSGYMTEPHRHASHPAIVTRLKRAEGHLRSVIAMIEEGRPCLDLVTQIHAVERAVAEAKRALIHDHIDHCIAETDGHQIAEIKALTKLL